jgi:hypothetical protein
MYTVVSLNVCCHQYVSVTPPLPIGICSPSSLYRMAWLVSCARREGRGGEGRGEKGEKGKMPVGV